ncbi:hypothetical protein EYF80_026789 [Liparis tanakae]|uniref:Uncharacterized protein n=1 Tax=Liparis tanakae TaxID=230148 RepID=A0A4Z2HBT0_9TELE|nr:hypothetical protein EYF80_026789 [Liparis tanakae]
MRGSPASTDPLTAVGMLGHLLLRGSVRWWDDLAGAEEDQAVDSHLAVTISQQDCGGGGGDDATPPAAVQRNLYAGPTLHHCPHHQRENSWFVNTMMLSTTSKRLTEWRGNNPAGSHNQSGQALPAEEGEGRYGSIHLPPPPRCTAAGSLGLGGLTGGALGGREGEGSICRLRDRKLRQHGLQWERRVQQESRGHAESRGTTLSCEQRDRTSTMPWLIVPYGFLRTSSRLITITMAIATATTSNPTMAPRLNVSKASGCYGEKESRQKLLGGVGLREGGGHELTDVTSFCLDQLFYSYCLLFFFLFFRLLFFNFIFLFPLFLFLLLLVFFLHHFIIILFHIGLLHICVGRRARSGSVDVTLARLHLFLVEETASVGHQQGLAHILALYSGTEETLRDVILEEELVESMCTIDYLTVNVKEYTYQFNFMLFPFRGSGPYLLTVGQDFSGLFEAALVALRIRLPLASL